MLILASMMVASYRVRLLLTLSVILVTSFLTLSFINFNTARQSARREIITSSLPLTRENIYSEIMNDLVPPINIASLMGNDSFLIDWIVEGEQDQSKITQYLSTIRRQYGYFSVFFISETTKTYYYFGGILKQISPSDPHDVWYFRFIETGDQYDLDVDTNEAADDSLTIFINYRLEDSRGNLLGVTGVGIEMKNFSYFLRNTQEKYDRRVFLVDEKGIIQAHSQIDMIGTTSIFDMPGLDGISGNLLIVSENPINHEYRINGRHTMVTARYIPEIDWFLIVEQDEESALNAARMNLFRTLLIGLATSAVIITVSYFAVRFIQGKLEYMTVTDDLTRTANRREFGRQFEKAVYRHKRYSSPISVILIDVDRFKEINDTKGHLAGDEVLKRVSLCFKDNLRPTDLLARWGGDEFIILAESDGNQALDTAKRLCRAVQEIDFSPELESIGNITISCGVTGFLPGDTIDSITHRADQALYRSKEAGRNRVSLAT